MQVVVQSKKEFIAQIFLLFLYFKTIIHVERGRLTAGRQSIQIIPSQKSVRGIL